MQPLIAVKSCTSGVRSRERNSYHNNAKFVFVLAAAWKSTACFPEVFFLFPLQSFILKSAALTNRALVTRQGARAAVACTASLELDAFYSINIILAGFRNNDIQSHKGAGLSNPINWKVYCDIWKAHKSGWASQRAHSVRRHALPRILTKQTRSRLVARQRQSLVVPLRIRMPSYRFVDFFVWSLIIKNCRLLVPNESALCPVAARIYAQNLRDALIRRFFTSERGGI